MAYSNHKILAILPARAGSKRIPGKNKKMLSGKPLFTYILETALDCALLDRIVVNSDDQEILEVVRSNYNRAVALERPQEIAGDQEKAITYVQHTLEYLKKSNEHFHVVVILQPTSPFTTISDVEGTVKLLIDSKADSAVSVVKVNHMVHPFKLKTINEDLRLDPYLEEELNRTDAHELPPIFVRNCSVYATTLATINEGLIIGADCRGFEMPEHRSIDINDPIDFEFAEFMLNQNKV